MSKILFLIYFFSTYCIYAQNEVSSFYFKSPQPVNTDTSFEFHKEHWGAYYKSDDSLVRLIVEKDSIFTEFVIMLSLSKQELRKDKKLSIDDSLLFGVKANYGIPYMIFDDTLYAVILQNDLFFKIDENNPLKYHDQKYFLNYKNKNGFFSTTLLSFEKESLLLSEIDHYESMNLIRNFNELNETEVYKIKTYIATPSEEEFFNFIKNNGFSTNIKYHK